MFGLVERFCFAWLLVRVLMCFCVATEQPSLTGTIVVFAGNRSYQRPHLSDPQFYWMSQGLRRLLSDWDVELSEEGITLLEGMLQVDPRLRLTVEEVRNHI